MFIISVKLEFLVLIELIVRYAVLLMSILYEPLYEYYIIYFLIFARIMIIICPT